MATFTTVAFLAYLYDLKVRRVETAHPIRETRGFSRAQTGDLITAILPLTWSATMVMHASTHSINFDENTAGTAFSLTVVAYQWGWNYYFPRDIVAQFEAAPRLVGRGRIVAFEVYTPTTEVATHHLEAWALRALTGGRHGSRSGRFNAQPASVLSLPADIFSGAFAAAGNGTRPWRQELNARLAEIGTTPAPLATLPGEVAGAPINASSYLPPISEVAIFRARPTVSIEGNQITLGYRHFSLHNEVPRLGAWTWIAADLGRETAAGSPAVATPTLPSLTNLAGAPERPAPSAVEAGLVSRTPTLDHLRAPVTPRAQHLIWTGPDATTGAGATSLGSTEDQGWSSPTTAREASLRSARAAQATQGGSGLPAALGPTCPLLLPLDAHARALLAHPTGAPLAQLPFTWTCASQALETGIDTATAALWASALAPDLALAALSGPAHLAGRQSTTANLRSLARALAPAVGVLASPLSPLALPTAPAHRAPLLGGEVARLLLREAPRLPDVFEPLTALTLPPFAALPCSKAGTALGGSGAAAGSMGGGRAPVGAATPTPRLRITPSPQGLGLDEARLVRTGSSRLADPALFAAKLDSWGPASLSLPQSPLSLLGLGWSTSASLASYPSFKVTRGGLLRRPYTGVSATPQPLKGLAEPFAAPLLGKLSAPLALPTLTLAPAAAVPFRISAPSHDRQVGAWALTWAVVAPAPAEDLDPTFVSTAWALETNTTRRSDHNSRYLVSWSPLAAALTTGAAVDPYLSGPAARAAQPTSALRASVLALNELGLRNSSGLRGVQAHLAPMAAPTVAALRPATTLGAQPRGSVWLALWAAFPAPATAPAVLSGTQQTAATLSGRAATLATTRATLGLSSTRTAVTSPLGGGDSINPFVDLLARLEYAHLDSLDAPARSQQGFIPLSSSISASRRLRVTKGVTLPSDTPIHVICGSKDVIHSWAIPGLGIKIDCIPGYNSHRRLLLRWRGAYWGQCMEVCGRYHHWMPIMVNVTHPALFLDWCLAFLRGIDAQAYNGGLCLSPAELSTLLTVLKEPTPTAKPR